MTRTFKGYGGFGVAYDGCIKFRTDDQSVELSAGQMSMLEHTVSHDVEALSDSAFLLTIAWPGAVVPAAHRKVPVYRR